MNALEIADEVIFLAVNRCRYRIELVSHFADRPAQKACRGVLLTVNTILYKILGRLKYLLACFLSKL